MNKSTPWESAIVPKFSRLSKSQRYDVVVIGGGITGLSAAYFLKRAGKSVCLLERNQIGSGDTGCTTAHLTYVTDLRLSKMVKGFGEEKARLTWRAGATAIDTIESIVKHEKIDCEFRRVPGFLHAGLHSNESESADLEAEARLASQLGFDAQFVDAVPYIDKPGIRFADQAKFHPLEYLGGLARAVDGDGCAVFEHEEVTDFESKPLAVKCGERRVECEYVVVATHVPLMGKTGFVSASLLQTKLFPYLSYAVGAKITQGMIPEASYWDTSDPYYYLRVDQHEGFDYAIFGGEDHKTGQEADTENRFDRLRRTLLEIMPTAKVDRGWSGQVIETNDGLPYIGESAEGQFIATGFSGNGMTLGTVAGLMARDTAIGKEKPWQELFAVGRTKLRGAAWEYVKENIDYPYYLVKDRLKSAEGSSTRIVKRGEGKILELNGKRVACFRDENGKLHTVSAICTHLGCVVGWNNGEQTWDCPCHGSRFRPNGEVLAGPAETPLEPVKRKTSSRAKASGQINKP